MTIYRGPHTAIQEAAIMTLVNLAKLFTPGIKLSLIARHISDDAAFMIFSEDNLDKVIETIQRHQKEKREAMAVKVTTKMNGVEV